MSVNAYVLVVGDVGMAPQIVEAASKIAGVKLAQSITGAYDVIVAVEAEDTAQLSQIVLEIESLDGVVDTDTCVVLPT